MKIDLHIHSTASDGTLTPLEIVQKAVAMNLGAISITDHDTLDGVREVLSAGTSPGLDFLTGVEISTSAPPSFRHSGSMHLLGYGIDAYDSELNNSLNALQNSRADRNPKIINRLNAIGVNISLDDVVSEAGECQLGRPHIAKTLVSAGYVASVSDAFDRYIGKTGSAYVDKYRIECEEAIRLVRESGGVAVLAHPSLLDTESREEFQVCIETLVDMGLSGIEVYYPSHTSDDIDFYTKIAKKTGLIITGGSDYHGDMKDSIEMGTGSGNLSVPYSIYEKLVKVL